MGTPATRKGKRLTTALAAAVAHPLRTRCLAVLAERVASPAEIARQLSADVSNVGYHVNSLAKAGLIEKVGTRPVRGAVEHFYRAVELPAVETEEQAAELSVAERRLFAETIVSLYAANAMEALESGSLAARPDWHVTRLAMNVDEEAYTEMKAAYMDLYERVFEIRAAAAERMGKSDEPPMRVVSFLSLFELPKRDPPSETAPLAC
jgi:DNA-binding transcriptional ArsR family regulator